VCVKERERERECMYVCMYTRVYVYSNQNGRHESMPSRARVVVHKDDRLGPSQLNLCPVSKVN
jgi:hypothetical protein